MKIKAARKMKCGKARYHKRFMKLPFVLKISDVARGKAQWWLICTEIIASLFIYDSC